MKKLNDMIDFIIAQENSMSDSVVTGMKLMLLEIHEEELNKLNIETLGHLETLIDKIKAQPTVNIDKLNGGHAIYLINNTCYLSDGESNKTLYFKNWLYAKKECELWGFKILNIEK